MLWWTVLFLPRIEKLWQHDSIPLVVMNLPYQNSFFTSIFKMDGFESRLIFSAFNIALKWQKSTKHTNSELETSSSTQKNVKSFFPLDLIMIMLTLFWLSKCCNIQWVTQILCYYILSSICGFLYSINQNYIQCFAFVLMKLTLYSVLCMCIQ